MTLDEKLGEIILRTSGDYENVDSGVSACASLRSPLDGPWGWPSATPA